MMRLIILGVHQAQLANEGEAYKKKGLEKAATDKLMDGTIAFMKEVLLSETTNSCETLQFSWVILMIMLAR